MLNQAGRNTAPFHLEFKQTRQMELAHLIGLWKKIVLQKSLPCQVSSACSPRSARRLIQVHPDENALPATGLRNRGTLDTLDRLN
jgi:hypothetical protein